MEGTTLDNLPRRIGRYDVAARVAGGGSRLSRIASEVFIAADSLRATGKAVAIKRVAPWITKDTTKADAYVAKVQDVAKRLRHPNVVEIRAVGAEEKDVYLVMDYMAGETLARFVGELHKAGQTLQTSTAAYIVAEACAGLDVAHRAGIVHGHLTPYDVFIGYDGAVRVLDIGVAAAKVAAVSEGEISLVRDIEIQYSSPEVCRGQSADRRSDVFSMGAILWELLTGVSPFERTERAATIRAICDEAVAAPAAIRRDAELPGRMSEITMDALAREPETRCSDAAKLRQLLLGYVGADKPARAELSRLLSGTFERRKSDKEKLVACVARRAPAQEYAGLDFSDDPLGMEPLHGADLDARSPSGISTSTGGAVTAGPKVVLHRPQSDPSLRTSHPAGDSARERKSTAPLIAPPMPDSTPSAKPPHVPFYDEDEEARRRRQEPTSLIARPPGDDSVSIAPPIAPIAPAVAAPSRRTLPLLVIPALLAFVVIAVGIFFFRAKPQAHATTQPSATASATAPATAPIAELPPTASLASTASSIAAPATSVTVPERTTLSIDTVPSHASISVNGERKGKSPIELKVPKSTEEVVIEIQHPGYVTMKERVVPDVNQRLKLSLVASGGGKPPAKPGSNNPYKKFE